MRFVAALLFAAVVCAAQQEPRSFPPKGIAVRDADRAELAAGVASLDRSIAQLGRSALLPDVQIFRNAVHYALTYDEFYKPEEIARAKELLRAGQTRADDLAHGRAPWTTATGLVVRGYVSKIDGSVQPYGLVVPANFNPAVPWRWRLDTWFHGRNETLTEGNFLYDRMRNPGEFTPANTIVLHLYGRYCNASKFAGEIDLFEALDAVKRAYPIDDSRIALRGFSMGGASTWHLAAHYGGEFAVAAPGAGFAETAIYQKFSAEQIAATPDWQRKLWRLYDVPGYAVNLFNLPVIAYSGEVDPQKQAADLMAQHMTSAGLTLKHIIGPKTAHKYHPDSKADIDMALDAIMAKGRNDQPRRVRFATYTLRYNRMKWLRVDALQRHWEQATVDASFSPDGRALDILTTNIDALTIALPSASALLQPDAKPAIVINGQKLTALGPTSDGSWSVSLMHSAGRWALAATTSDAELRKRHGLQGPIDDAFLDSFVFVTPTGTTDPAIARWVSAESARAISQWRSIWRGEPRVKRDTDITEEDISSSNLVLWGDAASNQLIRKLAGKVPVSWSAGALSLGPSSFPSSSHVPILIYPNPLNPRRYIVFNSGPTQREADSISNSRQVPRLPDYAIVDITTPPDQHNVGRIAAAGFFDEHWRLSPAQTVSSSDARKR